MSDYKWDGRSRPSDNVYRERWDEIFGKKEDDELKESYKQSLKNKKERDDKEKSVSELLREGYEEEKAALEKEEAEEGDQQCQRYRCRS